VDSTVWPQRGKVWQELPVGSKFRTAARTLTESDLVNFVGYMGFTESLFQDETYVRSHTQFKSRIVPAALTFCVAEGLVIQTGVVEGTGIALLEASFKVGHPVFVNDTIHAEVEVVEVRPTSTGGRAVVKTANRVLNQAGEVVMEYWPLRLIKGGSSAGSALL
jgi:acyl dehydratase